MLMFVWRNCMHSQLPSLATRTNGECVGGRGRKEVRWVPAVVAVLARPLCHAYRGVSLSLSLPLFGLTCLDIQSAPSALNTLGPSVSPAPYWIGWALAVSKWADLLLLLFVCVLCGRLWTWAPTPALNFKPPFQGIKQTRISQFMTDQSLVVSLYRLTTYSDTSKEVNRSSCHPGKKRRDVAGMERRQKKRRGVESRGTHRWY